MTTYLDSTKRREIVAKWIPICLVFLHAWASMLVVSVTIFNRSGETIDAMFNTCGWGITGLILLLVSDRALELFLTRVPGLVEKTTTEKVIVNQSVES